MNVIEQLCIKSYTIREGSSIWKAQQGIQYTTSVPADGPNVQVFSNYWVWVPKEIFVPMEIE